MIDPAFDVLAYAADVQGSHRGDLRGVGEPLPEAVRDLLSYVRDRLLGTTSWLRLVLVTQTHKEARVTAFLAAWAYECHWMADALTALVGAGGPGSQRSTVLGRAEDRLAPLFEAVVANVHGDALTAVQMAERVVDLVIIDRLVLTAAALAPAGTATDLGRIHGLLDRQRLFFTETAAERLASSARARCLTRSRLSRRAWPIRAERDPRGTARAFAVVTRSDPGWPARLDLEIEATLQLPGLHLVRRSVTAPGRPVRRAPARGAAAIAAAARAARTGHGDRSE